MMSIVAAKLLVFCYQDFGSVWMNLKVLSKSQDDNIEHCIFLDDTYSVVVGELYCF